MQENDKNIRIMFNGRNAMSNIRKIYVEKKKQYDVPARKLEQEIKNYLGIKGLKSVRVLVRYMIENVGDDTYKKALNTVFMEPLSIFSMRKSLMLEMGTGYFLLNIFPDSLTRERIPPSSVSSCSMKGGADYPLGHHIYPFGRHNG